MIKTILPEIPDHHVRQQTIKKINRALNNYPPRDTRKAVKILAKATQLMPSRDKGHVRTLFSSKTVEMLNSRPK